MDDVKEKILVVDDEESIRAGVSQKLLSTGYDCMTAANGKLALEAIFKNNFDLILLDIKMPGLSGMEVLRHVTERYTDIAVIMLSALVDTETAVESMRLGAYDYITKPVSLNTLVLRVEKALERRRLIVENREYHLRLEQKVGLQVEQIQRYYREALEELAHEETALRKLEATKQDKMTTLSLDATNDVDAEEIYWQMARSLAQLAEAHEPYIFGHAERVSILARKIAAHMGCPLDHIRDIQLAAILHDIGKISIPDHILFKPGRLTPTERYELEKHPAVAANVLRHIEYFTHILPLIEYHHEWYNGEGYPIRLKGEDIPLGARILAVASDYDAMTCPRPYRPSHSSAEAIQIFNEYSGIQWDPQVVDTLLQVLGQDAKMQRATAPLQLEQ
ncbi:MAG: response regulator [Chloroflexota bacterium]|nr:response regulator [Chloroflexota bacterium]